MASTAKAAPLAKAPTGRGGRGGRRMFENGLILIMVIGLGAIFLPTAIIVMFAMLPSLVAFFLDRDVKKSMTFCIGALNVAGTVPVVMELWSKWNTVSGALALIASAGPWLYAWGGAIAGWLLCMMVPPMAALMMRNNLNARMSELEEQGTKLEQWWGPEVVPQHLLRAVAHAEEQARQAKNFDPAA